MYFIFRLEFDSNKSYIRSLIQAYAKVVDITIEVVQDDRHITLVAEKGDKRLESFLLGLEDIIPASLYLKGSNHQFLKNRPNIPNISIYRTPHNIAPCPTCQKEMFDIYSSRYYYPFTSCNHCGGQHPFLEHYPFIRENTTMKFLQPCKSCLDEVKRNPFRESYPLISCPECGVSIRMLDRKSERYANDKESYKRLFEVAARAISEGKTVLVKTLNGYRKFFKPTLHNAKDSILLMISANSLNLHLMVVNQEFNALLSIERPIVRISTKSDELKEIYGSSTFTKYPDEGMSILLARELLNLGLEYIAYRESNEKDMADLLIDFDIPITFQDDAKLFINQNSQFFINAQRLIFPTSIKKKFPVVSLAHGVMAVGVEEGTVIDYMDRFKSVKSAGVNILDSEEYESGHRNEKRFESWRGSMLSILAEHDHIKKSAIGVHFDDSLYFLYYNSKEVINVVPPNPFEVDGLFGRISELREGSDKLVENYRGHFPKIVKRLESLDEDIDIFTITAIILELEDESFEGISTKALEFMGKGGIQIDTHIRDNRFDNYAFLASIMSYKMAGAENSLICYSIFESFGDYIGEIVTQLMVQIETDSITFSGETFANWGLFSRIKRHLGMKKLLFPKNFPIGRECQVFGGLFV